MYPPAAKTELQLPFANANLIDAVRLGLGLAIPSQLSDLNAHVHPCVPRYIDINDST